MRTGLFVIWDRFKGNYDFYFCSAGRSFLPILSTQPLVRNARDLVGFLSSHAAPQLAKLYGGVSSFVVGRSFSVNTICCF